MPPEKEMKEKSLLASGIRDWAHRKQYQAGGLWHAFYPGDKPACRKSSPVAGTTHREHSRCKSLLTKRKDRAGIEEGMDRVVK